MAWGTVAVWGVDYSNGNDKSVEVYAHFNEGKLILDKIIEPDVVFVCSGCPAEFDPCTPSFAKLLELAKQAGWLMKWKDIGYDTYCPKCGKL